MTGQYDVPPPPGSAKDVGGPFHIALSPGFRIRCLGPKDLQCTPSTRVPGGNRVRVTYSGGTVRPLQSSIAPKLSGVVLTGGDWIVIRDDGMVSFDGRLTIGKSAKDVDRDVDRAADKRAEEDRPPLTDDFFANVVLGGVADFEKGIDAGGKPHGHGDANEVATKAKHDFTLPVVLPAWLEASGSVPPWASARVRQLGENLPNFGILVRRQCVAVGSVAFRQGLVHGVTLDIVALEGQLSSPSHRGDAGSAGGGAE